MHYFRHQSVPDLSSILDEDFWKIYVLHKSTYVPAVQHAIIAFSTLYENYLAGNDQSSLGKLYSRQQYGRAIKGLRDHLNSASCNRDVAEEALLTCLLFVCFELLQGNDLAALVHLEAGLGIFSNLPINSTSSSNQASSGTQQPLSKLATLFLRLDNQATSLMGSRPPALADPTNIHTLALASNSSHRSDQNISQARDFLHVHLSLVHDFLRSIAANFISENEYTNRAIAVHERDHHLHSLRGWMHEYQDLLERGVYASSTSSMSTHHYPSNPFAPSADLAQKECAILYLIYLTTFIKLSTSLDLAETAYDAYLPQFCAIILHAEIVLDSPPAAASSSPPLAGEHPDGLRAAASQPQPPPHYQRRFTPETQVIHPLYFTAFKCRDLSTRQRAIALMRGADKEGAWDGDIFARIAEQVRDLEDNTDTVGIGAGAGLGGDRNVGAAFGVPELERVHSVGFDIRREERKVRVWCCRRISMRGDGDGQPEWVRVEDVISY